MRKYAWLIGLLLYSALSFAEQDVVIRLDKANINLHDKKSIERGGKFFATTCMVCHTLIYMRYDSLAKKVGVVYEKMPVNVTKWPLDVKPPDLSLEVNRRGADWVYTYLHSFYLDPTRPTGTNNLLFHNTAMTNVLAPFQGLQSKIPDSDLGELIYHKPNWFNLLKQTSSGSMSPEEFDATIRDVVTFLAYASAPYQLQQEALGKWVLVFLFILFILAYFLKRSYWQDLKRSHDKSE